MAHSTMMKTPLLMSTLMDRGALLQPDNLIITRTSQGYASITHRESARRSKQLANALAAAGVARTDRVATLCWNTNRHLQCYHAIPSMGAVLHTLNVRLGPKELGYIIRFAEDKVIVVDASLMDNLSKVSAADMANVKVVVVCGADEKPGGWQGSAEHTALKGNVATGVDVVDWDDFLEGQPTTYTWPMDLDENAPLALCFTSGTTGNPKGVVYSHRGQYVHTLMLPAPDCMNLSGKDVMMPVVPYFHANGWGLAYAALLLGARVVHNGSFTDPKSLLEISVDHRVTFSAAVPTVWQTVRQILEDSPALYKGKFAVQQVVCGGSSPPNEMMKWYLEQYGTQFVQAWGMTETSPIGTFARQVAKWEHTQWDLERQFSNVTKTGLPVATIQMKIVDKEDFSKELPWDGIAQGELLVKGPHVTGSYYKNPQPTKFVEGWLATGDIASITADGYMMIRDRSKDVIKSGGEWISSQDLEKHIMGMPSIMMAAVVAAPHPKWDERPIVVVVMAEGKALTLKEVRDFCAKDGTFAKYELPDDLLVWKELPLTGTGKIDKKSIRARLDQEGYLLPDLRTAATSKL